MPIIDILRKYYPPEQYVVMGEVSDRMGSRNRSLDYMVMSLWPSRGLHLHGIELKSHRSDWLNELKNPAKQENHFKYCDKFWLLTDSTKANVASIEEIPPTWGWMNIVGDKLKIHKQAPDLNPEPLNRHLLAAMLRRAGSKDGYTPTNNIEALLKQKFEEGKQTGERENHKQRYDVLVNNINAFERASGISIAQWHTTERCSKIGTIVKMIEDGQLTNYINDLNRLHQRLKTLEQQVAIQCKSITDELNATPTIPLNS